MKDQEWYEQRVLRIRDLCFGAPGPDFLPEMSRILIEIKGAVENLAIRGSEDSISLIIHHILGSRAERKAFYERYGINNSCLHMQTLENKR